MPNILNEARKFVRMMLHSHLQEHSFNSPLTFGNKLPFKELKNLILNLRRGPWRSEVDWVAWTDWLTSWYLSFGGHWLEQAASSSNWTKNYEDACLLACLLAFCKEIPKKKKRSLSRQTSVTAFFESSSRTRASPPLLLDIAHDDPDGQLTVHEESPAL
jgi:hypothetical protein